MKFCQKICYFWGDQNQIVKIHVNFLSCIHYHWTRAENVRFGHHRFWPTIFSVDMLSNVSAASLNSLLHDTVFNNLFQMAACVSLYTREQCLAINRLSIASTSTNFLSLVFVTQNFVLFTFGSTKRFFDPVWVIFATSIPLKFTCFAMICTVLLQTSQQAFLESAGHSPSQILNTESCNHTCLSKI